MSFYTRKKEYNPQPGDRNKLLYTYSNEHEKIVRSYNKRYIRVNDYEYDTYMGYKVKEHYMLIPKFHSSIRQPSTLCYEEYFRIKRKRENK